MKNKIIALDIGNVIADVHIDNFINALQVTGIVNSYNDGISYLENIQAHQDLGLTTIKKAIEPTSLSNKAKEYLSSCWMNDVLAINQDSLNFIKKLKEENYTIALLSNIGFEHASIIKKNPLLQESNNLIHHFSCEVGARKPSFLFYQSFLLMHPEFKNSWFVDDREENVLAARKVGFQAIQFDLVKSRNSEIKFGPYNKLYFLLSRDNKDYIE